ncbi:MAG: hypothetical protein AMXMBFR64_33150 [Myxococcales bacterium]
MDEDLRELVWSGTAEANPWWRTGLVPPERGAVFRRHAFDAIFATLRGAERGRGVVVLGPRRVGKTVLVHQLAEQLLREGVPPRDVWLLPLDDVALRDRDIGELLELIRARLGETERVRYLLLDEVQRSRDWSGWLKRIADRRDPFVFFATGSSATALRRGGQDAGLGRWREMTLFPWSFREHVHLRGLSSWTFTLQDDLEAVETPEERDAVLRRLGPPPPVEMERLEGALVDYLIRGGFPEAATAADPAEARRRLRQDILDRSLGRDVLDVADADPRTLERLFLRICLTPGGLWNESEVSRELQVSRPTVARYLRILEEAFLVFRFPNLASPVKGQPKVYLVAPSLRQALLGSTEDDVRKPEEWGRLVENAIAAAVTGTRPDAAQIGFWRRGADECDVVVVDPRSSEYIEVKRSASRRVRGPERAAEALGFPGVASILGRDQRFSFVPSTGGTVRFTQRLPAAAWLYGQRAAAGGTLRLRPS